MMPAPRRSRRKWILLAVFAGLLLAAAWWVDRQLEPHRLTALVLEKSGASLALDLSFDGDPDYVFRPEPRLRIPNLVVRDHADGKLLLSAKLADISLPWATITGGEPVITRIELDHPMLDLPTLRRWQAARPPAPFKLPTLLHGIHARSGTVQDEGYRVTNLDFDLPRLRENEPASAKASGRFSEGETVIDFDIDARIATPGLASDFGLRASGSLQRSPTPLAFKADLDGRYQSTDAGLSVATGSLSFAGDSPLPRMNGKAQVLVAEKLGASFDGVLRDWPRDWPSLPAPLPEQATDLTLRVSYQGSRSFTDPIHLHLEKNSTSVDATMRLADIQDWMATPEGTPLPPLSATVTTPRIELDGIRLEGVEVELHPDEVTGNPP